ncbi:hypothetical protein L1887_33955 [Cichorium endivia]|nr:hypothetical protein L1887_33955 [Cichorium endivia]
MITQQASTPHNFSRFSLATGSRQNGNSLKLATLLVRSDGWKKSEIGHWFGSDASDKGKATLAQVVRGKLNTKFSEASQVARLRLHRFSSFHLSLLRAPYFPVPSIFLSGQPIPQFIRSKSVRDLLPTFGYITSPNSYCQVVLKIHLLED